MTTMWRVFSLTFSCHLLLAIIGDKRLVTWACNCKDHKGCPRPDISLQWREIGHHSFVSQAIYIFFIRQELLKLLNRPGLHDWLLHKHPEVKADCGKKSQKSLLWIQTGKFACCKTKKPEKTWPLLNVLHKGNDTSCNEAIPCPWGKSNTQALIRLT